MLVFNLTDLRKKNVQSDQLKVSVKENRLQLPLL